MAVDRTRLIALAEAISDGAAVDWADAESSSDPAEVALVRELRLLAGLADVHRSGGDSTVSATVAVDDLSGRQWGPLTLIERIGAGSFGSVYRARDSRLARDVALKLLHRASASAGAASSIVEEGRVLAKVRHPHVITVFGADRFDDCVGIWMELIRGRTLEQVVRQDGPLGAREAALIGIDLCSALAAVHAKGIVHRDVKAQNVMREEGGRIVLMDFGAGADAAHQADRQTGTPAYMAPELFDGVAATPQSDIYSLGVLLFWLVTGEYPVEGRTAADVRSAHARGARRLLRDVRPDLPAEFIAVVDEATAASPAKRPPTAGQLGDALHATIHGKAGKRDVGFAGHNWRLATAAICCIALLVAAAWVVTRRTSRWPYVPRHTVALAPFRNLTGDNGQEFLAAGFTELVGARLGALRDIRLIPPTSTGSLAADDPSTNSRMASLGADYLLRGSVSTDHERVIVTASLIDLRTGIATWAHTFEQSAGSLLKVQSDVAMGIVGSINGQLFAGERERLAQVYTSSTDALNAYLRGRYLLYRFDRDALPRARTELEHAIAVDPRFALAHASLARVYLMLEAYGLETADAMLPASEDAATRAVTLDPSLPEAHIALAEVLFKVRRDWFNADNHYRLALELAPHNSLVLSPYGRFLSAAGQPGRALELAREGAVSDPLSGEMLATLAITHYYLRHYEEATQTFDRTVSTVPGYAPGYFGRGRAHAALGQYTAAIEDIDRAIALAGEDPSYLAEKARVQAAGGWRNGADQLMGELLEIRATGRATVSDFDLACVYAQLGDRERALDLLDAALRQKVTRALFIRVDPRFDSLRSDARFADLLKELGGL